MAMTLAEYQTTRLAQTDPGPMTQAAYRAWLRARCAAALDEAPRLQLTDTEVEEARSVLFRGWAPSDTPAQREARRGRVLVGPLAAKIIEQLALPTFYDAEHGGDWRDEWGGAHLCVPTQIREALLPWDWLSDDARARLHLRYGRARCAPVWAPTLSLVRRPPFSRAVATAVMEAPYVLPDGRTVSGIWRQRDWYAASGPCAVCPGGWRWASALESDAQEVPRVGTDVAAELIAVATIEALS